MQNPLRAQSQFFNCVLTSAATPSSFITLVKLEYWHQDAQGSLIATTDQAGQVTQRYAYDPFGKRRYTNGNYDPSGQINVDWSAAVNYGTQRGYTGHEQLDDLGLVHMNGRIFDPTLGIFLQADPFIQDPGNLQNYNRYGYCLNSPLTCTDPSGYLHIFGHNILPGIFHNKTIMTVAAIAVSIYLPQFGGAFFNALGATTAISQAAVTGFISGAVATGNIKGALQGAFTAGMFAGAGNVIGGGNFFTGGASVAWSTPAGIAVHGVVGCVTSVASGGKCGPGALSAAFTKELASTDFMQGLTQAAQNGDMTARVEGGILASIAGGTASVLGGGKFSNGAMTGAFSYLFNDSRHRLSNSLSLEAANELDANPRVQAFLKTLADRESGGNYNVIAGGGTFDDYSEHPNIYVPSLNSTAAGAYQFTKGTWDDVSSSLGLTDFTPHSQDLGAIYLLNKLGAINSLMNGNLNDAIFLTGKRWDAFPINLTGKSISGGNRPLNSIVNFYKDKCQC